ncbi:MAG: type I-U CRISPR-associated protein Cas5/Cas6 [Lysobacterales bacterium]|nr:MAG: type I-U CRISPR-associated protein Cas5/Cas6 [Xanthomonadales bacterium]
MLALEIEFLLGRVLATARDGRDRPEWPPHPGRLFAALLATLHEADLDDTERAAARAALAWLETLPPPAIRAEPPLPAADAVRTPLPCWVPVNPTPAEVSDARNTPRAFLEGIRLPRKRAERHFPAYAPIDPVVSFVWNADPADCAVHAPALDRLARELVCLGHSASPVRAHVPAEVPVATLLPAAHGSIALRVPGPGRLARLEACHAKGLALGRRIEAPEGRMQPYAPAGIDPEPPLPRSRLRFAAVFRRHEGPALPAESIGLLAQTVRATLLSLTPDPVPAVISGHEADRSPGRRAHLAIVPLPRVDDPHADGTPHGFALLMPDDLAADERAAIGEACLRLDGATLRFRGYGDWHLQRLDAGELTQSARTLQPASWSGPATRWASATPLAFGHHPRPGHPQRDALVIVARHCADLGLPAPAAVRFGPDSRLIGALPAAAFREGKAGERWCGQFLAHVEIDFAQPVAGPLVLGAGRHFGLGLMRPLPHPRRCA